MSLPIIDQNYATVKKAPSLNKRIKFPILNLSRYVYEGVLIVFNEMYVFYYVVSFTPDVRVVDTMRIIVRDHPLCKPPFSATALPCDYANVPH